MTTRDDRVWSADNVDPTPRPGQTWLVNGEPTVLIGESGAVGTVWLTELGGDRIGRQWGIAISDWYAWVRRYNARPV